jgi:hypothetical protein
MIKSNPSLLLKRRVKRQRPRSASAVIRRCGRSVIAAFVKGTGTAASAGSSSPDRRRRRIAGFIGLVSLLVICMIASGTTPMRVLHPNRLASAPSSLMDVNLLDSELSNIPYYFPQVVNLWPNDRTHDGGESKLSLASCTDGDAGSDPCRLLQLNDNEAAAADTTTTEHERVGIVRVPGRLGLALEEAVRIMIVNQTKASSSSSTGVRRNVELVPTSFVEHENDADNAAKYSRIIRIATQPLLLDVMDLALDASESKDQVTSDDLLCILRLLVQWHCHHNAVATASSKSDNSRERRNDVAPVLTISAQAILSHPSDVRKQLSWFLNRKARDVTEKTINEWMNDVSHRILQRIDECSETATLLQRRHPDQDMPQRVQTVVREEVALCRSSASHGAGHAAASTSSPLTTARCEARGDSQPVEIAEILLSVPDAHDLRRRDTTSLCGRFPSIQFCQAQAPKQPYNPPALEQR